MDQTSLNTILPPLVFFLFFFLSFTLIELVFIFSLNSFISKYWEFAIDIIIRAKVHYGKIIKIVSLIFLLFLLFSVYSFTPFFEVLTSATPVLKNLSIILFIVILLIYFTTTRRMSKMALEKKVNQYIYFILSIIFYVGIVIIANSSYGSYQNYVNTKFINPTIEKVRATLNDQEKSQLLSQFKQDLQDGKCSFVDYSKQNDGDMKHFIFIANNELTSDIPITETSVFAGQLCSDTENTFLLTENGEWYWVIAE